MSSISLRSLKILQPNVGASATNLPIAEFAGDFESALNFRADIVVSSVVIAAGITLKLQHRTKGGAYEDLATVNSSVSVAGNGTESIVLHVQRAADQADLPLRKQLQLVVSSGVGDSMVIDEIVVQQR